MANGLKREVRRVWQMADKVIYTKLEDGRCKWSAGSGNSGLARISQKQARSRPEERQKKERCVWSTCSMYCGLQQVREGLQQRGMDRQNPLGWRTKEGCGCTAPVGERLAGMQVSVCTCREVGGHFGTCEGESE